LQAQLDKALVDYEEGETYPSGSKERNALMSRALTQFEELYKQHRERLAGLAARMWQAKCYEERGELGSAMGIYNALMQEQHPLLRRLQRHVGYFRIVVMGKRKEYALAVDEARRWLQANEGNEAARSQEGLGVQLEMAKGILAQLPEIEGKSDRTVAINQATDVLRRVIRYSSPHKNEALALLKKYRPVAAANANELSRLSYEDALGQAEEALAEHSWVRAEALLRQAIRRAESARDIDKTNYARYSLAFCYYMDKRPYEALVLAEHLARRYPRAGLSPRATEIGLAALGEAYENSQVDRNADLNNLVDLASYAAETYPEAEEGDTARLTLGKVYRVMGRTAEAIAAFQAVRPASSKRFEALQLLGVTYWLQSRNRRRDGKKDEADAERKKAIASLQESLKGRKNAGAAPSDPGLIATSCDLADVYLDGEKPLDAVALLEPLAKAQDSPAGKEFARLMADLLRAHVATNQVNQAMADMTTLEKTGGAGLTQLYYGLGRLLEREIEALRKRGDSAGLDRAQKAYQRFLSALVSSKSGQSYESLQWAGENMLTLGHAEDAEKVFRRLLENESKADATQTAAGSDDRLLKTRLKLAAALRAQDRFTDAETMIDELIKERPRSLEVRMEKGMLLEDRAASVGTMPVARQATARSKGWTWSAASAHWRDLALQLGRSRTKPVQYYEAWYHAAYTLYRDEKPKEARQTLASVMRLSTTVGGPEIKAKYKALLDQIK
jgi:tetratricopeptide (TPR) repeat protein